MVVVGRGSAVVGTEAAGTVVLGATVVGATVVVEANAVVLVAVTFDVVGRLSDAAWGDPDEQAATSMAIHTRLNPIVTAAQRGPDTRPPVRIDAEVAGMSALDRRSDGHGATCRLTGLAPAQAAGSPARPSAVSMAVTVSASRW
jgi:hypothetical protein